MLIVQADDNHDESMSFYVMPTGNIYMVDGQCQQRVGFPRDTSARIRALCTPGVNTVVTWDWFATHIERIPA